MTVDLYDILGIARDADADEIKQAFRDLARQYHPDRNPDDPRAEERFKEALAAFEILSNPQMRRRYDREGLDGIDSPAKAGFRESDGMPDERGFWSAGGRNLGEIFADILDGNTPFDISHFEDVAGFGASDSSSSGPAGKASRHDEVRRMEVDFLDAVVGGDVPVELDGQVVRVALQPGTRTGDRLRVERDEDGDLLIDVEVRGHDRLNRDGLDLSMDVPVTYGEAIRGGKIRVPTPEGDVRVDLPAGVDSGTRLRLAERGVRREGDRGDFYAVVRIVSPDDIDDDIDDALDRIEDAYSRNPRDEIDL